MNNNNSVTVSRPRTTPNPINLTSILTGTAETLLIGTGFTSSCIAYSIQNTVQTQLTITKRTHTLQYDILTITPALTLQPPYSILISDPQSGVASNQLTVNTYTPNDTAVQQILLNGVNIVKNQTATITTNNLLPMSSQPSILYGTTSDSQQTTYSLDMVKGVQTVVTNNGDSVQITDNQLQLPDFLQNSGDGNILYGNDSDGVQTSYPLSQFATSTQYNNVSQDISTINNTLSTLDSKINELDDTYPTSYSGMLASFDSSGTITNSTIPVNRINMIDTMMTEVQQPVGAIIIQPTAPAYGSWEQISSMLGTVWQRIS